MCDRFAPQLLIVSAGFDAHERDPLASMRVTAEGYAAIVRRVTAVARRHGALALGTEGGYELTARAACLEASFAAIGSDGAGPFAGASGSAPRGERALRTVRAAQAMYWRGI